MERLDFYKPNNAFLSYLADSLCKTKKAEQKEDIYTIDGDIVSQSAMANAVEKGKGVIIGGFFVGATLNSDMDYDFNYSFSV